jgi:hypothetical protein
MQCNADGAIAAVQESVFVASIRQADELAVRGYFQAWTKEIFNRADMAEVIAIDGVKHANCN